MTKMNSLEQNPQKVRLYPPDTLLGDTFLRKLRKYKRQRLSVNDKCALYVLSVALHCGPGETESLASFEVRHVTRVFVLENELIATLI